MVQLMPLHPKTPLPLASFKSRLVLHFWYWLTQVVPEKRPLNGCLFCFTAGSTATAITKVKVKCAIAYRHSRQVAPAQGAHLLSLDREPIDG